MNGITWIHVAGGMFALLSGAVAVAVRKGDSMHVSAGTWFCVSMLVLGVTASILAPFKSPPDSPIGGIMVCHFVATAWMAARRRSGAAGRFEKIACAIVLVTAIAGQQDVMPQAVRGSPILLVLAFAPFALMLFWLARVRFSKMTSQLKLLDAASGIPTETRRHA